jgi:glucan biosynthesis protein C
MVKNVLGETMASRPFVPNASLDQLIALRAAEPARRLAYVDNLRWLMVVLVISMHAADTYSPLGNWYYVERPPIGVATLLSFAAWQMYLQSFFMGLLFFIAGVFTPASIDRKGPRRFVRDRAFRLGLPVLFYMFVLGPITEYYVAHSWTAPYSFAHEWWHHITDLEVLQENGPLWFCLALLIFEVAYAALYMWRRRAPESARDTQPPGTGTLIGFALTMAAGRFVIRFVLPGVSFLNMHLGDFAQYILLFSAGIVAARNHWLPKLSLSLGRRWMMVILPVGFAAWLAILAVSGAFRSGDVPDEGWHWQSAALSIWESFTCVAMCLGLLTLFREKFNAQGRLARFLSDNAFSVYVFHPPIVIIGARLLHSLTWAPLAKFVILTGLCTWMTFTLSALVFRRIPVLRAIL